MILVEGGRIFHDVGKLGIGDVLLQKSARLSEEEWEKMRRHPAIGVLILQGAEFLLKSALDVIPYHHERYGGGGSPWASRARRSPSSPGFLPWTPLMP